MANKVYDKEINRHSDWGGDDSTENLPVSGSRVQEFIKKTLDGKMGVFYYVLTEINKRTDRLILSGFVWKGVPVWLSMENQLNYKTAYDLAVQTNGQVLPTFKFGTTESPVYYKFESLEDLKDFYISAMSYITDTLATGCQEKDKIDWTVYEDLLK